MIIESCHELVPPEEIKPITEKIINNYVTEYCQNQAIVIGLNTIREILTRMPLALDEAQIEYLVEFRHYKKNSSVRMAGKSLVNFFRDVCPQLLPKKYIGRFTEVDKTNDKDNMIYGERRMVKGIDGVELLKEGDEVATQRILTDEDLKRIRIMKLKQAAKQIFKKESDDDEDKDDLSSLSESSDAQDQEDGEEEMSENDSDEKNEEKEGSEKDDEKKVDPERKAAIEMANRQYDMMHASSLEDENGESDMLDGMEEGEMEMEEGEFEWEEGESELEYPSENEEGSEAP